MSEQEHTSTWDHRQAELWDRIFQVTNDVVTLADTLDDAAGGVVVKTEVVKAAMGVGLELVRANASGTAAGFRQNLDDARLKAIETDYWLRMAYVLQQRDEVQRDLSSIITQYTAIVELLEKMLHHTRAEQRHPISVNRKGPKVQ